MTRPNREVFYSRRDWWASLMVWGIAVVCWIIGIQILAAAISQGGQLFEGVVALLAGMGAPWFWLTTRYTLSEHRLVLVSGPFFKRIDYADIQGVRNGRKEKGLSFAFSMDCLQIDVVDSSLGFRVSPNEQRRFLLALANRCDHLVLQGQELVLRD
jgi:hypothetical protein